ncbi:MAG: hypothetical protein IPH03_13715 [Tetrasphaera sp.]|nr:hypothetical protein [Tetrasphaera sp.]
MADQAGWLSGFATHPQAQYFVVGRLRRDQVESYAATQKERKVS